MKRPFKSQWYRPLHMARAWAQMTADDVVRMDTNYCTWKHIRDERGNDTANQLLLEGLELEPRASVTDGPLFTWKSK